MRGSQKQLSRNLLYSKQKRRTSSTFEKNLNVLSKQKYLQLSKQTLNINTAKRIIGEIIDNYPKQATKTITHIEVRDALEKISQHDEEYCDQLQVDFNRKIYEANLDNYLRNGSEYPAKKLLPFLRKWVEELEKEYKTKTEILKQNNTPHYLEEAEL